MLQALFQLALSLLVCALYGYGGWFLFRNPVRVLDFLFKQYDFHYGRFGLGFFRIFGAVMVAQAGIGTLVGIVLIVARMFGRNIG